MILTMIEGADLPDLRATFVDYTGAVVNLSAYTFSVKVAPETTGIAAFTKTAGITGAATAPNVTIAWTSAEVGALTAGRYVVEITAIATDLRERRRQISLDVARRLI